MMGFVAFFFVGSDKGENEAMESCKYQPPHSAEYRNLFGLFGIKVQEKKTAVFLVSLIAAGKQTPQCYPSSVTSARTMMLFNLGSAYCLRSEYDKARKCLHQVWKTKLETVLGTNLLPSSNALLSCKLKQQSSKFLLSSCVGEQVQILWSSQLLKAVVLLFFLLKLLRIGQVSVLGLYSTRVKPKGVQGHLWM